MSAPARTRGRPPGRAAKTRPEILEAAAECFRRLGYHRARMDDVAEALGITKSSLYHYVRSKEELLFEIIGPPYRDAVAHLREVSHTDAPAPDKLRAVVARHLRNVVDFYPAITVYVTHLATLPVPEEVRALDAEYVRGIRQLLLDGMRGGSLRVMEPGVAALMILGPANWFAVRYTPDLSWDIDGVVDDLVGAQLHGLTAVGTPA